MVGPVLGAGKFEIVGCVGCGATRSGQPRTTPPSAAHGTICASVAVLRRPKLRAQSLPVIPMFRQHDRKQEVLSILSEHAAGQFRRVATFIDEMLTNDRIAGVIETRIGGILSAELEIRAARDKRKERKVAELLGGVDDARGIWPTMVSPAALFEILKWGLMLGIAVGQIVWDRTDSEWRPRLVPWHPQYLRWDENKRCFAMQTTAGEVYLPNLDDQPDGDGQWFIWAPHGLQLGWLGGMVRSLAEPYLGLSWAFRDFSRYVEKHGLAMLKAIVPSWAKPLDRQNFFDGLANIGSEAAVLCPTGDKDKGSFDFAIVEAQSRSWEAFVAYKQGIQTDVAIRVLGQNLTTEAGTDGGSRAATKEHTLVRIDKAIEDSLVGDAFTRQILSWYTLWNYGTRDLAPAVIYHVEPAEDSLATATALKTLGEALSALKTAEPRVDVAAILEAEGVPLLSEQELAEKQAAEAEQAAEKQTAVGDGDDTADGGDLTADDADDTKIEVPGDDGQVE
jgi:phage gp29-like protein